MENWCVVQAIREADKIYAITVEIDGLRRRISERQTRTSVKVIDPLSRQRPMLGGSRFGRINLDLETNQTSALTEETETRFD